MEFEWDSGKARANERKHGISFEEASSVFGDELSLAIPDPYNSMDEERYLLFGRSDQGLALVVSYTERYGRMRIISARRMTASERKAYEQ